MYVKMTYKYAGSKSSIPQFSLNVYNPEFYRTRNALRILLKNPNIII